VEIVQLLFQVTVFLDGQTLAPAFGFAPHGILLLTLLKIC
jgi:hypothetical protein